MPIAARGFRVEPMLQGAPGQVLADNFQVVWLGFAATAEPEPPEPPGPGPFVPTVSGNLGGGGGRIRQRRRPEIRPPDALRLDEDAPDLAAHMLAARLSPEPHGALVVRLAWRMRRPRR